MPINWIQILKEQAEIAQRLSVHVPAALESPDLTLDQASRIYRDLEHGAQALDGIIAQMNGVDADDALFEIAIIIEDVFDKLAIAAANKVRTMQGLQ